LPVVWTAAMTACPTCGHDPAAKHRGELERQFPAQAAELRRAAEQTGEDPHAIGHGLIGWRGLAWTQVQLRKPATCIVTGRFLNPGDRAWRQLSEQSGRDQRVADDAWSIHL
jgi:hypothetical protein